MRTRRNIINAIVASLLIASCAQFSRSALQLYDKKSRMLQSDGEFTLLVVFKSSDCESYRPFITDWRRASAGNINVLGVAIDVAAKDEVFDLAAELNLPYPIRPNLRYSAKRYMRQLGLHTTPAAVLIDSKGRPGLVLDARSTAGPQNQLAQAVADYVDIARNEPR